MQTRHLPRVFVTIHILFAHSMICQQWESFMNMQLLELYNVLFVLPNTVKDEQGSANLDLRQIHFPRLLSFLVRENKDSLEIPPSLLEHSNIVHTIHPF